MDEERDDDDAGLPAAAARESVLAVVRRKVGREPGVTLHDSSGASAPVIDPRSGERLAIPAGRGNYQLLGEIARGGMGIVLKGHDTDLGRDVALKVLNRDFAERPELLQRFVEEAQIGGQLQHPGIVPVYELGLMADDRPYFTMKLVKGRTLATLLSERESPARERRRMLDVFESVCQTMAYAHSRGVIHRDLKPANVMVGAFGEVQVVDWGLAKVLARGGKADERRARDRRTIQTILTTVRSDGSSNGSDSLVGSVMGTPAYMAPEQASGHVDRLDERSDVFSLGAILCEILTGAPPYVGDTERIVAEAAQAELDGALARLDSCEADAELVKLTRQCLTPAPQARPRNAGVVAERIHRHLESLEERALALQIEAAEAQVHAQEERRARKLTLALAAAVFGIGLAGGGGFLWVQSERALREREAAAREVARVEHEADLAASVDAALRDASLLAGQERWSEALVAVERAAALSEAGQAGATLRGRIAAVRDAVESAADTAEERAAREQRTRALVSALDEIEGGGRGGEGPGGSSLIDWAAIDRAYVDAFAAHGLDVDGAPPAEVAAALGRLGIEWELVPALHWWMAARRERSRREARAERRSENVAGAVHLVDVAHLLDGDPLRADLREAMVNDDHEMLALLAGSDLTDQPPATLALLGAALTLTGDYEQALAVLRASVHSHPDEYYLRAALLKTLYQRGRRGAHVAEEYLRHLQGAVSLRPDNLSLRRDALWIQFSRGVYEENRGDEPAARLAYLEFLEEAEVLEARGVDLGGDLDRIGMALCRLGEPERAVEHYQRALESRPDSLILHQALALLSRDLGRLEEAEAALVRALEIDPESAATSTGLAAVRAFRLARAGDGPGAVASLEAAVQEPMFELPVTRNNLAWRFATVPREELLERWSPGSEAEERRVDRALEMLVQHAVEVAERAVEASPVAAHWNTLGVLRYRAGDFAGCLEDLERSMELTGGNQPSDLFFVAMAHKRLGRDELARTWYFRAELVQHAGRMANERSDYEDLRFREEAAELLGVN